MAACTRRSRSRRASRAWPSSAGRGGRLECVTPLPLPVGPENAAAVAAAIAAANRTLAGSSFVVADEAVCHVATAAVADDGSLPEDAALRLLEAARVACETHFGALFRAATGVDTDAALDLEELRRAVAEKRPRFAPRLERPVHVEAVANPWFRRHHILFVQSASPIPAIGITVCRAPSGRVFVLAGNAAALNEVALAEGIELTDEDALAYANLATFWTREADFPELRVDRFDEIPFRSNLPAAERLEVERLRREVGSRLAPLSFVRTDAGWRLDVWMVSVSRLIHRVADVQRDGTIAVRDEIVASRIPVPPGAAWGMVGDRLVPVG